MAPCRPVAWKVGNWSSTRGRWTVHSVFVQLFSFFVLELLIHTYDEFLSSCELVSYDQYPFYLLIQDLFLKYVYILQFVNLFVD